MNLHHIPLARAQMLIRQPASVVFEAFVDPRVTKQFWFSEGSGKLEKGREVQWRWHSNNRTVAVMVKAIEADRRILIEWSAFNKPTLVELVFEPRAKDKTMVKIANSGFEGDDQLVVDELLDSTCELASVLAGAKAYLEHGVRLNLVDDYAPEPEIRLVRSIAREELRVVAS